MKAIYEPTGKAREYGELAVNLYTGCAHGCLYCYAPKVLKRDRVEFHSSVEPRRGILKALEKEAPQYKGREVFLCFTCDPYPENSITTRTAIEILNDAGVAVNILTKAGALSLRDIDLLAKNRCNKYGATLVFWHSEDAYQWEPHAALPEERIAALKAIHARGIHTWVSLEPVIDPNQSLQIISFFHGVIDEFKIGKWNYDYRAKAIDWHDFAHRAIELCKKYEKKYYIKKDLAAYL